MQRLNGNGIHGVNIVYSGTRNCAAHLLFQQIQQFGTIIILAE